MGRLVGMITRVGMWAGFGAVLGFAGVAIYQMAFTGGSLQYAFSSVTAQSAAGIGLIVGGIIGFVKRY